MGGCVGISEVGPWPYENARLVGWIHGKMTPTVYLAPRLHSAHPVYVCV